MVFVRTAKVYKATLKLFSDRYTKNLDSGWEETPKVRVPIINFSQAPTINHVFLEWLMPNTTYKTPYLDAPGTLNTEPAATSSVSYQSDVPAMQNDSDTEELHFEYTFAQETQELGIPDDKVPDEVPLKYLGPTGMLRASMCALDQGLSKPYRPVQAYTRQQLVPNGETIKVKVPLWPVAFGFHKGRNSS
ncbi:hypothetical protein W97_06762 [Coniosporium apollinis CBS 100218]|uniref:Uncharacterized protein n=1 Tax=Coniosporium apollinis (strain CBS 100218) TaxID=1168221 RepID=R7Z0S3_CONA1|nr:uncharacterized protein W97_06762 [Coniosporium apollinis CBS 100218]EON67619.1 hypothetical protein W97_06762 [Coniosporium apollinis CBS 100218]